MKKIQQQHFIGATSCWNLWVFVSRMCNQLWLLRDARLLGEQLAPSAFCPHRCGKHLVLHQPVLLLQVTRQESETHCWFDTDTGLCSAHDPEAEIPL